MVVEVAVTLKTYDNALHASSCTACCNLDVLALISMRRDAQKHVHVQLLLVHQALKCVCIDVMHTWMPHWKWSTQHSASSIDDVHAVVPRHISYKTCMYNQMKQ